MERVCAEYEQTISELRAASRAGSQPTGENRVKDVEMGAHVEVIEYAPKVEGLPCIKPNTVVVNGVDVGLIKRDSVILGPMLGGDAVEVTLTLLARSVEIRAVEGPRPGTA